MNHPAEIKAKLAAYHEIYIELLNDHRIPYDVCSKIKEKIKSLEAIAFVDEVLAMEPVELKLFEN